MRRLQELSIDVSSHELRCARTDVAGLTTSSNPLSGIIGSSELMIESQTRITKILRSARIESLLPPDLVMKLERELTGNIGACADSSNRRFAGAVACTRPASSAFARTLLTRPRVDRVCPHLLAANAAHRRRRVALQQALARQCAERSRAPRLIVQCSTSALPHSRRSP